MSDASNTTTMPFPVVELLEASKADTEEIVTDTPTTVPATTKEMPAVTTTLTMPVVTRQKRRRVIDWLNSWGPTKVLVLPTAAVVGLYIGALIATPEVVPDAMTPDTFAKKPSVTQTVEPTKPSKMPVSDGAPALPTDRHIDSRPVEPKTTPTPGTSVDPTPSSSTSTSPSSTPSIPSFETPGKGGSLSPQPSASTTNSPSASPSDAPITSEPPEETSPAPSDPAPLESTPSAAETGVTP